MPQMTPEEATAVAGDLFKVRNAEYAELKQLHEYAEGDAVGVYMPQDARDEYRWIAQQARVPIIPKMVGEHVASLFVEGYRGANEDDNLPAWVDHWQANRMDARQTGVHKAALDYGYGFVRVLPGDTAPAWAPFSPRDMTAVYGDAINDEWPEYALSVRKVGKALELRLDAPEWSYLFDAKNADAKPIYREAQRHGVPWTPVVRFLAGYDLDGNTQGLVEPLIELQNQVNLTTLNGLVAQVFGAFRQKWATGIDVPLDEQGRPVEPFKAAVQRLWIGEGEAAKFGDFDATDLQGYLSFREDTIRLASTVGNVPPHTVLGALANLSAESLAAAEVSKTRYEDVLRVLFGEAWESCFRLSRFIAGDTAAVGDTAAEVVWRDTEARSWSQMVDAAVKLRSIGFPMSYIADRLGVSPQALPDLLAAIEAEQQGAAVAQAQAFGVIPTGADTTTE